MALQEKDISLDEDEEMDDDTINIGLSINIRNDVLTKSLVLEGKIHSAEMKTAVGKNYEKLHLAFDNFQNVLKTIYKQQTVSGRPEKQATITYIFTKTSTSM